MIRETCSHFGWTSCSTHDRPRKAFRHVVHPPCFMNIHNYAAMKRLNTGASTWRGSTLWLNNPIRAVTVLAPHTVRPLLPDTGEGWRTGGRHQLPRHMN
jgi:hypothetical protein